MRFFIDQNLGVPLAHGLKGFGEDVVHLSDLFPDDTDDDIWLEEIGEKGWVLVTRDNGIRRRPLEVAAVRRHRVGAFYLGGKKLDRCEIIRQTVRNWSRIKDLAARTRPPFAFRVAPNGTKIERIF